MTELIIVLPKKIKPIQSEMLRKSEKESVCVREKAKICYTIAFFVCGSGRRGREGARPRPRGRVRGERARWKGADRACPPGPTGGPGRCQPGPGEGPALARSE